MGRFGHQGERNAKDVSLAANYERQLSLLIDYYRSSWNEFSNGNVSKDFPFYFVQLLSWLAEQSEPVEPDAAWAVSRDMMRRVANTSNTGTAVSLDTGDAILHTRRIKNQSAFAWPIWPERRAGSRL